MSSFQRGVAAAFGLLSVGAVGVLAVIAFINRHVRLSDEALSDIAQIGATLLVAYAVEMSWVIKESRIRGSNRENWVGFVTGIGIGAAVGIGVAVGLVGNHGPADLLESLGGLWILFSLGFLALLVALLPYLLYDLVHALHTEYPDE